MYLKLSHLTQVISGYSFRGSIDDLPNGTHRVILVRDLNILNPIDDYTDLLLVNFENTNTDAIVKPSDILLSTRGTDTAGLKVGIYNGTKDNVIATSSLFILRVNKIKILPEYLLFYLNSRRGQNALKNIMSGATVKTISKKEIADIQILVPPIKEQTLLVGTLSNMEKQTKLLQTKIQLLNLLIENILSKTQ